MKPIQKELPGSETVFNLRCECGEDPERVLRESNEAKKRKAEAEAYAARCQKTLESCPGFIGCDAPAGQGQRGVVVVEPGLVGEAMTFLRRRFSVNENLQLDAGRGICLEVASRIRKVTGKRRVAVTFAKPVQFQFEFDRK